MREFSELPGMVPLFAVSKVEWIDPLIEACLGAGVSAVEIVLRTECSQIAVEEFVQSHLFEVGVGTVTSRGQIEWAAELGVSFGLSPWFDPGVASYASSLDFPFIPGIATPSEARSAVDAGFTELKVFPIRQLGGVQFLSSLAAVFPGVSFWPTGGVSQDDSQEYLALDCVQHVSGSWPAAEKFMVAGEWERITQSLADAQIDCR